MAISKKVEIISIRTYAGKSRESSTKTHPAMGIAGFIRV